MFISLAFCKHKLMKMIPEELGLAEMLNHYHNAVL